MHVLMRGSPWQLARLASGLLLFAFALTHFINHALGLVSLDALAAMQHWRIGITRSLPGSLLLGTALIVHIALGLVRLAQRRTWRMPAAEAVQIASGLLIPFLLFDHITGTRLADLLFGADDSYGVVIPLMWLDKPLQQSAMLLIVWTHACFGIHMWLRLTAPYRRIAPLLLILAVIIPTLALAGFAVAGRDSVAAMGASSSAQAILDNARRPDPAAQSVLEGWHRLALAAFALPLAGIAAAFMLRCLIPIGQVAITYTGGERVRGPRGATLLEISRLRGVPHASACGGRARCSTCRVRIDAGGETLPLPAMAEAVTLGSIGAPPGVRLACQIRPQSPMTITRLVAPGVAAAKTLATADEAHGVERKLAVLFLDVRGFTRLSEKRLPYDVVYLLNQFFGAVGTAIQAQGGWIDKYLGDGLLAVFGRESGPEAGCRQALAAARDIDLALDRLNVHLAPELGEPLRIGIGIHAGDLVVGHIGHADTATITVIGSTVNVASRLESLTKDEGVQLIVSRVAADMAGWDPTGFATDTVAVRGHSAGLAVILVPRARDLPQVASAS